MKIGVFTLPFARFNTLERALPSLAKTENLIINLFLLFYKLTSYTATKFSFPVTLTNHLCFFIIKYLNGDNLMINSAFAQTASNAPDPLMSFLPLILMFVVLYFLMIRPQMKRAKEHKLLVEGLQKNDEVITTSGIVGKITNVDTSYVTIEIGAEENKITTLIQRQSIQTLLPKGTIKSLV
tara:strand:+ start:95 stop:637 length:543 start_codon:yes stop_codon:yes gene_type:complete